ncbi:hypothetical protein [Arthrobacter oryzae]|jgi:hypothetical protein|uniref:hypothetical protein n=1 Tax=Arthrobacter oryzae TaxID=409290 RepID=UPI0028625616|nr:hypothetical protein [Arthrobacter oryzae]MDR6505261.1 hypothetical protein [Arthrobacter oryzae]
MTIGDLWPHLRPLCRALALLGWVTTAVGMAAGLSIAVAGGTSLSPTVQTLQLVSVISMGVAVISFIAASLLQPQQRGWRTEHEGSGPADEAAGEMPPTVRSFLLAAFALLAGAVVFACAGLVLRNGPSAQSVAFCQVFLLGAAASGFTFMLFSKVAPRRSRN